MITATAFAAVAASTTAGSVIAAVTGRQIRVQGLVLVCGGTATTVTFNSATTAISATFSLGANGVLVLPVGEDGWFETAVAAALTCTTGSGSTVAVHVIYSLR